MAQEKVRVIRVKMDDKTRAQAKAIERNLMGIDRSLKRTAKSASTLKNAFLGITTFSFAGIGLRSLVDVSDSMQLLTDRVGLFTKEGEDALEVMKGLSEAASRQGQTVDGLSTIYTRLGIALDKTGATSEELLVLTESLAKSFRLAGATSAEVVAVSIQLSQAFAAGQLRGQELRSVVEQNAVLAQALTEKFKDAGLAGQSIFSFAEKRGGITAKETIEAIADQVANWEERLKTLNFTLSQTYNIVTNQIKVAWNEFNNEFKITATISRFVLDVFSDLTRTGVILASVITSLGILSLSAKFSTLYATALTATAGLTKMSFALTLVRANALALGLTLKKFLIFTVLTTAIYLAITALLDWNKAVKEASKLGAVILKIYSLVAIKFGELLDSFQKVPIVLPLFFFAKGYQFLGRVLGEYSKKLQESSKDQKENNSALKQAEEILRVLKDRMEETADGSLKGLNEKLMKKTITLKEYKKALKAIKVKEIEDLFEAGKISRFDADERIARLNDEGKKLSETTANLAKLNAEFLKYKDVEAYFKAMDTAKLADLQQRFKKGSIDLGQLKAKEFESEMKKINMAFRDGAISFSEFNKQTDELRLEELDYKLRANIISTREYNEQLVQLNDKFRAGAALSVGAERYIQRIGSVSNQVADAIAATFSRLEDSLFDFIKKGRFEFAKFTQAILDDLTRIIIRAAIIRPLAEGVLGAFSGGGGAGTTDISTSNTYGSGTGGGSLYAAKGAAFGANGVQFFANGGVVNSPTMFTHSSGLGVMGEAGPEAILPLKRGSDGNLGVQSAPANVIINVNNQSGAEVQQSETTNDRGERVIELLVVNTVKNGLAKGDFDKQFSNNFGLNRKR